MDTIFRNSENGKISYTHRTWDNLSDKTNIKRSDKWCALSDISLYYTWKNIKMSHRNYKFNISSPTCNDKFELPDESYSVSNVQDYFD